MGGGSCTPSPVGRAAVAAAGLRREAAPVEAAPPPPPTLEAVAAVLQVPAGGLGAEGHGRRSGLLALDTKGRDLAYEPGVFECACGVCVCACCVCLHCSEH